MIAEREKAFILLRKKLRSLLMKLSLYSEEFTLLDNLPNYTCRYTGGTNLRGVENADHVD